MKKLATLIICLVCSFYCFGQTSMMWQQIYGGTGVEAAYGVRTCLGQGYIVVGTSSSAGPSDSYFVRTDSIGLVTWSKFYGGVNVDVARAVEILPDSGFIVAGYTNSFGNGGYDGWLLRLDKNGDTLWTKTYGTQDWDFFYDVECCWDGGFVCTGGTYGRGEGDEDLLIVRFDANGDTLWSKTHGGIKQDEGRSIVETEDSLLAVAGYSYSLGDTLGDCWILRLEMDGDTIWTYNPGIANFEDKAFGVAYDSLSNIILYCGYSMATNQGEGIWEGLNYNGTIWFSFVANNPGAFDSFYAINSKPGVNPITAVGTTFTQGGGLGDMWIFTTYPGWHANTFGTLQRDEAYDFDFTNDGGYILCGMTFGYNSFSGNMYVVKADTIGECLVPLGIPDVSPAGSRTLVTSFPVPASTEISFLITSDANMNEPLDLVITNSLGEIVARATDQEFTAVNENSSEANISTVGLASGIYFYTLIQNSEVLSSGKFIVSNP